MQSNATATSPAYGVEYHVWPTAAPAAWVILSQSAPALLSAALPSAPALVTAWSKVRGGNLITTSPEGTVDMLTSGGERRVLAGSASAADYTITANATLLSGDGILSATIKGNTLTASLDGTRVMSVPDLAAASAAAAKLSTSITVPVVPPQAGFYGLRAWGSALVHFQQVTVGTAG